MAKKTKTVSKPRAKSTQAPAAKKKAVASGSASKKSAPKNAAAKKSPVKKVAARKTVVKKAAPKKAARKLQKFLPVPKVKYYMPDRPPMDSGAIITTNKSTNKNT